MRKKNSIPSSLKKESNDTKKASYFEKKESNILNDSIATPHSTSPEEKKCSKAIEFLNKSMIIKIKKLRHQQPTEQNIVEKILKGDRIALSRAITLIESTTISNLDQAHSIVNACLPHANRSIRIGITGVPGVGKSTFIEVFGNYITKLGKKVAVLAIDPSSSISYGSILGDKTRMEELIKNERAYIRPSPSGETLGGVAKKTRESIILCEACGFDVIIIETVGVGQSEIAVNSMVDFFLLLKITGAGDDLQGIKRGIMEMADHIVITKADGDTVSKARKVKIELNRILHFFPPKKSGWIPKTSTCSAITHEGIENIWTVITDFVAFTKNNDSFYEKRKEQNQYWLLETINNQLKSHFYSHQEVEKLLEKVKHDVLNHKISPFSAAQLLLTTYFKNDI